MVKRKRRLSNPSEESNKVAMAINPTPKNVSRDMVGAIASANRATGPSIPRNRIPLRERTVPAPLAASAVKKRVASHVLIPAMPKRDAALVQHSGACSAQTQARPATRLKVQQPIRYDAAWKRLGLQVVSPKGRLGTHSLRPPAPIADPHLTASVMQAKNIDPSDAEGIDMVMKDPEFQPMHERGLSNEEAYESMDVDDEIATEPILKKRTREVKPSKPKMGKGLDLSLPPLSNIEEIFADMATRALELGLGQVVERLKGRPINIATMCSGTESPLIALNLLSKSLEQQGKPPIHVHHHFSAEIDVVKQGYIERNFCPEKLFRDIREFISKHAVTATTAYGSEELIPGSIDILIAGFVCKDLSRLNNHQKSLDDEGESGDTWTAIYSYVTRFLPGIVLLENVQSTISFWNGFKAKWDAIGYESAWMICDSKDYYLPQTRNRMYMIAVNRKLFGKNADKAVESWKQTMKQLKRRCSSPFDDFLSVDTPEENDYISRISEPNWDLCKLRYDQIRSEQHLGIRRPVSRWNENGTIRPPDFANRGWYNSQSSRVYDCIDIAHLQAARRESDSLYKMLVWDVSQNVDRFKADVGMVSCITPNGCSFASNKQTALTGSQLLLLQGMPADKLLFAGETQRDRQDLAGNAMSTTVIGASIVSALIHASEAFRPSTSSVGHEIVEEEAATLAVVDRMTTQTLHPPDFQNLDISTLIRDSRISSRLCNCEGTKCISKSEVQICQECNHTVCSDCSGNPTHSFASTIAMKDRYLSPVDFERKWRPLLPSRLVLNEFPDINDFAPRANTDKNWNIFAARLEEANIRSQTFSIDKFRRLDNCWTVTYVSAQTSLELRIEERIQWHLYVKCPKSIPGNSELRKTLRSPVARGTVEHALLEPKWELFVPRKLAFPLYVSTSGKRFSSWRNRIGLPDYRAETVPMSLTIDVEDGIPEATHLAGEYMLLPHCGTAMSSLYKKSSGSRLYLFLESNPIGPGDKDAFIFSDDCRRVSYGKTNISLLTTLDPSWRPWDLGADARRPVTATSPGIWRPTDIRLVAVSVPVQAIVPSASAIARFIRGDCSQAVTVLSVDTPEALDVHNFSSYSWALAQAKLLPSFDAWQTVDGIFEGDCTCTPPLPRVLWSVGGDGIATAHEDRKAAAIFERAVHSRRPVFDIRPSTERKRTRIQIGINVSSLIHRAKSRLVASHNHAWRLLTDHVEPAPLLFPKFCLQSNASDSPFSGPLRLQHELGEAQKRSLTWMQSQEAGESLIVTEVEEAIHPALGWRVEARADAEFKVRGGVLADLPSFGKTVTTIALIQSEFQRTNLEALLAENRTSGTPKLIDVSATLIVCPPHIAKQWRSELAEFLGGKQYQSYRVLLIERLSDLERLTIDDMKRSKTIILSWKVLNDDDYLCNLGRFAAMPEPAATKGRAFDAWLDYVVNEMPDRVDAYLHSDVKAFAANTQTQLDTRLQHPDFRAAVPIKLGHGSAYQSYKAMQGGAKQKRTAKKPSWSQDRGKEKWIPLLQMFRFNRIVVDEYHYLFETKNYPAYAAVKKLSAVKRWALSGTPALSTFSDINQIATLLDVKLGRDVFSNSNGNNTSTELERRAMTDRTDVEKFRSRTELFSYQWHQARHERAQKFLDRFVRQNEPSLQHIACSEYLSPVELGIAHRTIYLELSQHLVSQRMQIKKLNNKAGSDRIDRLNESLNESNTAEEALLKTALIFKTHEGESGVDALVEKRKAQREETERELAKCIAEAESLERGHKVMDDHYSIFKRDVRAGNMLGDEDAIHTIQSLLDEEAKRSRQSGKRAIDNATRLKLLSSDLRSLAQELALRKRSERFVDSIRKLLPAIIGEESGVLHCSSPGCSGAQSSQMFVITHCGHKACETCLHSRTDSETCVHPHCDSHVQSSNTIRVLDLGSSSETPTQSFGRKLDAVADLIVSLPHDDQAIVFAPNEEAVAYMESLLDHHAIRYHAIANSKGAGASKLIEDFKTNQDASHKKKVLVLNLLDESAAGINLVNANHVLFVSPLLTGSQYEYDAAMAQAVARSRRYRQKKRVHIYHFAALRTIDVDILEHRHGRSDGITERGSTIHFPVGIDGGTREKTKLVRNGLGQMALVPSSWVADGETRRLMGLDGGMEGFTSLINFSARFSGDED